MVTFGRVPNPVDDVRILNLAEGENWDDRGQRNIVGVCVHRMDGTIVGTDTVFRDPNWGGLTDFGIGNGVVDASNLDGVIWQWNPLEGIRSPWANGWDSSEDPSVVSEGHGRVFLDNYDPPHDLNRDLASIENSGYSGEGSNPETDVTPAQLESLAQLIAYVCDKYARIPWYEFPYNKKIGDDFYAVYQHYEFAGKNCPYPKLKALHETYVQRAKEIMRQYQEDGVTLPSFVKGDKIKSATVALPISSMPDAGGPRNNGATMTPSDKLVATSRGSAAVARSYADQVGALRLNEVYAYINEVYRLAPTLQLDAAIIIAQSVHETGEWKSTWWSQRLNPAGLGITGDPTQNNQSKFFASGVEAARAHLAHMHAYVYGSTRALPAELIGTDPRYQNVFNAGYAGTAVTIADLANTWAVDSTYATGISRRGNEIYDFTGDPNAAAVNTQIGTLAVNTNVCVLEGPRKVNGSDWYRVSATPEGWISGSSLALVQHNGCTPSTPEPTTYAEGDGIRVTQGPKLVKARAGDAFATIYELSAPSVMCALAGHEVVSGVDWYEIRTTGGSVHGWISETHTERASQGGCTVNTLKTVYDPGDRIIAKVSELNVRTGPGTGNDIVTTVVDGTPLCVLSAPVSSGGAIWYQVRTTDHQVIGWVDGSLTRIEIVRGCPEVPPATAPSAYQINDRIEVIDGPLNVRASATTAAGIIGSVESGTQLCILSGATSTDGFIWQKVRTASGTVQGYVATTYTKLSLAGGCGTTPPPSTGYAIGDHIIVGDGPLNVRSSPSLSESIVYSLPDGAHMCVLGGPVSANGYTWYPIRTTGGSVSGWVAGQFTQLLTAGQCLTSPPRFSPRDRAKVKTQTLEVRSGPASNHDLVYTLPLNSWVCILSDPITVGSQTWYETRTTGGSVHGWVLGTGLVLNDAGGCVAPIRTDYGVGDRISVADGPLNIRSAAGTSSSVIGTADFGTHLCVLAGPSSANGYIWYQVRMSGGTLQGWVAQEFTQMEVVGGC